MSLTKPCMAPSLPAGRAVPHLGAALGINLASVPPAHTVLRHHLQLCMEAGRRRADTSEVSHGEGRLSCPC